MSELPNNWQLLKLKAVVQHKKGKKPKRLSETQDNNFLPYVDIKAFEKRIIQKYAHETDGVLAEPEDTLMVWDGARSGLVGKGLRGLIGSTLSRLTPRSDNIERDYLHHYFVSQFSFINTNTKGTGIPHVDPAKLWDLDFPLPPIEEQKRIADKLDSVLAKVEAAQARLDKIPAILKRFRQSVLAAATSGELTKEWREKHNVAVSSWCSKTVDQVTVKAFDGPFGSKLKTADYTTEGVRVARLENIGHMFFRSEKKTYISEQKFSELGKHELLDNDILFSSFVDEEIRVCKFSESYGKFINKADCFCLRPNANEVIPDLLVYFLASRATFEIARQQVHGATRPRVNLKFLKSLVINFPNIQEQVALVKKISSLFERGMAIENQYLVARSKLEQLSQSILLKAFNGELLPSSLDIDIESVENEIEKINV